MRVFSHLGEFAAHCVLCVYRVHQVQCKLLNRLTPLAFIEWDGCVVVVGATALLDVLSKTIGQLSLVVCVRVVLRHVYHSC